MVSDDNDKRRKSGAKISRSPLLIKKGGARNGLMKREGSWRMRGSPAGSLGCPTPSSSPEGLDSA